MIQHLMDVSVRSLLLAALAGAALLWRGRSAAWEHAVWASVVCGMLALLLFGRSLPQYRIAELKSVSTATPPMKSPSLPAPFAELHVIPVAPGRSAPPTARRIDWDDILYQVYLGVAALLLARLLIGMTLAWALVWRSRPVGRGVLESTSVKVPLTVGWLRPLVLLPSAWHEWNSEKLTAVLEHEVAHVRRRDGLIAGLAGIVRCILWFHPLAWWLESRLALLAELACDEACVAEYAGLLIEMAAMVDRKKGRLSWPVFSMAARSHLRRRVDRILDGRRVSKRLSWSARAVLLGCAIPAVFAAGAMTLDTPPAVPSVWTIQRRFTAPPPPPPPPGGANCLPQSSVNGARVDRRCVSLMELLNDAFGAGPERILAPDWAGLSRFDISANLPEGAADDQIPAMFLSLLEDRFGLAFHREDRESTVEALVVSKSGLKIKPAAPAPEQPAWVAQAAASKGPYGEGRIQGIRFRSFPYPAGADGTTTVWQAPELGFVRRTNLGGLNGDTHYEAPDISPEGLAALATLAAPFDPVVNMTGLSGRYQVHLDVSMADAISEVRSHPGDVVAAQNGIRGAVQDGLKKLEARIANAQGSGAGCRRRSFAEDSDGQLIPCSILVVLRGQLGHHAHIL